MRDEVLEKVISTDATVVPRYDIVKPDGTKVAENVDIVLKNRILVPGMPLNAQNLLKDTAASALGLNPSTATPSEAFQTIRDSVSYCPKLKVTLVANATLYVKNNATGVQQFYTVPSTGIITVDILAYGTYSVWGVISGVATTTSTITIDTTKLYTLEIDVYVSYWKFTVADEVGAVIQASHTDGTIISGTVGSDKTCTLALPKVGTWIAAGYYDNCTSVYYTFEATTATEDTTNNTTMAWTTITVYVDSGAAVTLVSGGTTKGGTSVNGAYKCWIPFNGTWSVTATLGSDVTTGSVTTSSSYQYYAITLTFYVTYGVRIPLGNSAPTAMEYTDGATGMSTGYAAWSTKKIFRAIKPCVLLNGVVQYYLNKTNLAQKEDGTSSTITSTTAGDVMVEVPKIGYRIYSDASYLYVKITDQPNAADFCYLAHSLDAVNDCDKIYYGAYLAYNNASKMYSISGATPTASFTLANGRAYASARGTGYQQMSFYPWVLLQCLYLIMYKNLNGQSALGLGYTNASYARTTGGANAKGPCYGETSGAQQMAFLNIEDFWGNQSVWLDGLATDSAYTIRTDYKNFTDNGTGYAYITSSGLSAGMQGFLTTVQGGNNTGFIPKAIGGSASTYYCDFSYFEGNATCYVGGHFNTATSGGPFYMYLRPSLTTDANIGSRLMYKHKG